MLIILPYHQWFYKDVKCYLCFVNKEYNVIGFMNYLYQSSLRKKKHYSDGHESLSINNPTLKFQQTSHCFFETRFAQVTAVAKESINPEKEPEPKKEKSN